MKADLHVHSRFSDRAPEWIFRRAGLPDCYTDPVELYTALRRRGMNFVTLTDHNRIDGCLVIADRPGTFLSEQVSARFPEDRCKVHVLVWGIDEGQHAELQARRVNIYELQKYLAAEQLAHAVAHPLYRLDDRFSLAHLEKLVLLFRHFEGLNGHRDALLSEVARHVFGGLTAEKIAALADRHGFAPTHPEPWRKIFIGGSDDHGGLHPGSAWTETPEGATAGEFLKAVRAGRCEPRGAGGTPLAISHSLYNNVRIFLGRRFGGSQGSLVSKAFSRFMEGSDPTEFSWADKLGFIAEGIASGQIFELAKPANASLWKQFAATFQQSDVKRVLAEQTEGIAEPERRAFIIANFFANQLAFRFFTTFVKQLSDGNIIEAVRELSVMLPILATLSPYLYAFKTQVPDRRWLGEIAVGFGGGPPPLLENRKRAWFTDTLEDVNGVATTIRKLTAATVAAGGDLTVVSSCATVSITDIPIKNFPPIGEFELPEYELQKLSFPPILEMIDYIQREGFTELIISTPGPVGLTALLAGKMLGLRTSGIYHTDFPQYIRILTDDTFLETLTWNFMKWFYDSLDLLYVNSEGYRRAWIERGIAAEKIAILPRGLDTALFHPSRRDPDFWVQRGAPRGAVVLLYVGRISKEKDLEVIASMWRHWTEKETSNIEHRTSNIEPSGLEELGEPAERLRRSTFDVRSSRFDVRPSVLAFVGDGPYLAELRASLSEAIFTGYLAGIDLARAYASADVFLFPSTTDTFGNVILEALASGVPCVVSDQGGPKDLIEHGVSGFITRALDADHFAEHVAQLVSDPKRRQAMSAAGLESIRDRDWADAGQCFWAQPEVKTPGAATGSGDGARTVTPSARP